MSVNPVWIKKTREELQESTRNFNYIIGYTPAIKWLVEYLSAHNIGFKIVSLGAGVKRIIPEDNICPCCNGTGRKSTSD